MAIPQALFDWQDRVVELRYLLPSQMADHPLQHKIHPPAQQEVLEAALAEVGIVNALRAYQSPGRPGWTSLDGHLRKSLQERPWPTLILDITDAEAAYLLALEDEIAALHVKDQGRLQTLLAEVQSQQAPLQALLARLRDEHPLPHYQPSLTPTSMTRPPVTVDDLEAVEDRHQQLFTQQRDLISIVCPHCLRDFAIEPRSLTL